MPSIGTNSKPAYVYDAGTDTWIPIGPGEHTHDYIGKDVITTTGDLIYASAANTPARRGIGSTGEVLTVSDGLPTWAAPASGGGMTSLATGSLSGSSLALTSISGAYENLQLQIFDLSVDASGSSSLSLTFMGLSADYRYSAYGHSTATTAFNAGNLSASSIPLNLVDNNDTDSDNVLIFNFYNYAASTRKIGDLSGYIDCRFSQKTIFEMVFGNDSANAQAALDSITLTTTQTFDGGTYKLWGIK